MMISDRTKDGKVLEQSERIEMSETEETYTMTIKSTTMTDAGKYAIKLTNRLGSEAKSADLTVKCNSYCWCKPTNRVTFHCLSFEKLWRNCAYPRSFRNWPIRRPVRELRWNSKPEFVANLLPTFSGSLLAAIHSFEISQPRNSWLLMTVNSGSEMMNPWPTITSASWRATKWKTLTLWSSPKQQKTTKVIQINTCNAFYIKYHNNSLITRYLHCESNQRTWNWWIQCKY